MHDRRTDKRFFGRLALTIGLAGCALVGPLCVSASAQEQQPTENEKARKKAIEIADKLYGASMKLNKDVATAIGVVRGVIKQDPFAIIDILVQLMGIGGDGGPPDITVRYALQQILAELDKTREQQLTSRAESLVTRFGELISAPEDMTFDGRLENYLDDSADLFSEMDTIMNNGDPARAELVYHLAPAYNTVASSRAVGLAVTTLPQSNIDAVMATAHNTNLAMISSGNGYGGYLYNVVQKNAGYYFCTQYVESTCGPGDCGPAMELLWTLEMDLTKGWVARDNPPPQQVTGPLYPCDDPTNRTQINRFDADPIVHLIRESATEQQLALTTP